MEGRLPLTAPCRRRASPEAVTVAIETAGVTRLPAVERDDFAGYRAACPRCAARGGGAVVVGLVSAAEATNTGIGAPTPTTGTTT